MQTNERMNGVNSEYWLLVCFEGLPEGFPGLPQTRGVPMDWGPSVKNDGCPTSGIRGGDAVV